MIERNREGPARCCSPPEALPSVLVLVGEPQSAGHARAYARDYLAHHAPTRSDDHVAEVALVVCELVTNAIRYGTEPGDSLALTLDVEDHRTRVEVRDPVRRRPRPRPESSERDRGRGLVILDAICPGAWGVHDVRFGKAVWAEVKAT
ncbi:ATP-binding protein [Streptomyces sp. NPDC006925]|uniref:ATP-binding protein n=1 Tax=Streptomyces sp. NPDC006925 TaxID=3364768 RepID=UPI0036926639